MSAPAGEVGALAEEVARLGAEVAKLTGIREALDRYTAGQAAAHYLVEFGRWQERDEHAARKARPAERRPRPEYLRPVGGDAS